jgi:O-antigen/teichoic acid export membrane protein
MSGSLLQKLGKESLIYGLSGVLTRFVSIFLTPIYTGIFVPSDYGIVSLVTTVFALLSILLILSLDNSMGRWYYDNEDEKDRKITLNTFLWSCFSFAVLLSLLVVVFRDFIAKQIIREPVTAPLLVLMAINLPLTIFSVFTVNVLRMQRKPAATMIFTLVSSLLNIGLNVLFVIILQLGIPGIFYAQLGTSIVAVIWTFVLFRKIISPFYFDRDRWVKMFLFSYPLIPGTLAYWVINLSGAYFIQLIDNTHEVGLYQIGINLASAVAFFTSAFQMAWGPFAYSIHKQSEAKQIYAQALLAFLAISCAISLGVMLFAPEILMILTRPSYYDAAFVSGLLAFNHIVIGLASIASIGPGIARNNNAFGISMVVSAGLLVAFNLVLVPRFGKEGAAISILLSQSIVPIALFVHGQKLYPIPYKFGQALFTLATSFILGVAGMWTLHFRVPLGSGILIKTLVLLFYCAVLFLVLRSEIKRESLLAVVDAPAV